jgi:hypothetical protein
LGTGTAGDQPISSSLTTANHALIAQKMQAESLLKSGAGWFIWIAGLSVVNTISVYSGSTWGFAAGLGITQIVDYAAKALGTAGMAVGLFINVMAVGFFVFMYAFARKAHKWAFITGLVFYALDTVLVLAIGMWFGLVIHALGMMGMFRGIKACTELAQIAEMEHRSAVGATAAQIG